MITTQKLIAQIVQSGVAKREDLLGVSQSEIESLEKYFGLTFPACYLEFLIAFGRAAGHLSPWMAIYFDDLKKIRSEFDLFLATQEKALTLSENALIIGNWESIFDYIICNNEPDPPVYRIDLFNQKGSRTHKYADSYSKYLVQLIKNADTTSPPLDFFNDVDTFTKADTT